MGLNVIVDKPITTSLKETKELLKIAKRKKILLAEATLFNYHKVFKKILDLCKGKKNISHIQSNFNIPVVKNYKISKETAFCSKFIIKRKMDWLGSPTFCRCKKSICSRCNRSKYYSN